MALQWRPKPKLEANFFNSTSSRAPSSPDHKFPMPSSRQKARAIARQLSLLQNLANGRPPARTTHSIQALVSCNGKPARTQKPSARPECFIVAWASALGAACLAETGCRELAKARPAPTQTNVRDGRHSLTSSHTHLRLYSTVGPSLISQSTSSPVGKQPPSEHKNELELELAIMAI